MARRTSLIVYVDKEQMDDPSRLFDAAFAHCVKKGLNERKRHDFIVAYTKAPSDVAKLKVIDDWVMVRDVTTFPFRREHEQEGEANADPGIEGGVSVDDRAEPESE